MNQIEEHTLETYKSLVTLSIEGLKVLQLLNGGAIVALLAYLGQISNRGEIASAVIGPLVLFVLGLVGAAVAHFGAYFTQLARFNSSVMRQQQGEGAGNSNFEQSESRWLTITIALASLSLLLFAIGSIIAATIFAKSG
jgi:hypothetical protein